MDTNYLENNYLTLVGKVTGEKKFSHEIYGESFYIFNLMIPRLSGNSDIIPITVSERLIKEDTLQEGNKLLVKGQFRSYNSYENERNRLILTVFAKDITELEDDNEEEIEENEIVSEHYRNRIMLIKELLKTSRLATVDLCVHINISEASYYRYINFTSYMKADIFIHACLFLKQYIESNHIPYTQEEKRLIKTLDLFQISSNSNLNCN